MYSLCSKLLPAALTETGLFIYIYTLEWEEEEETEARNCCPGPELGWPPGCFEPRGPREGGTGKGRLEPAWKPTRRAVFVVGSV